LHAAAALLAIVIAASPAAAETYRGEYTLSFLGLTVARVNFDSRIDDESYSIEGTVASAGLAQLFDDTRGTLTASGNFSDAATRPEKFRADYVSGGKKGLVDIRFAGGDVSKTVNVPPLKKRGNWVPISPADLKSVADPVSATLIRAENIADVCGRRIRLYDSELRADLSLEQAGAGEASTKGYSGPTVTCRLRFEPVAGYRKGRKSLEFLRTKSRIMVTFAQLGRSGVYAPIHATVGTEIGTITVKARRFEAL
jgi:hypothetical protein